MDKEITLRQFIYYYSAIVLAVIMWGMNIQTKVSNMQLQLEIQQKQIDKLTELNEATGKIMISLDKTLVKLETKFEAQEKN